MGGDPDARGGLPRWKLRRRPDGHRARDLHDAAGTVAVLSNRRSSTSEVVAAAPESDVDNQASPWEALPGAPVWAGPRIVAVWHYRREGPGRLSAVRVDRHLGKTDRYGRALAEELGITDLAGLADAAPRPGVKGRLRPRGE
ncbi:hypothetical protein OHR68_13605 [Spirillospora sp. NBC_00431]